MKQLKFNYNNKEYTLCYTLRSIEQMEARGFDMSERSSKPITTMLGLFRGAFLANHSNTPDSLVTEMYDKLTDKDALFTALVEMYGEAIESLFTTTDGDEGNVNWTKVM